MVSLHSQSTWGSRICHKLEPPHVAVPWAVQDGASGSAFAGKHHLTLLLLKWHLVPLVASQVCGSCLAVAVPFLVRAGEAPEDLPPRHPTPASHLHIPPGHPRSLHTVALFLGCSAQQEPSAPGASALDHGRAKGQLSHPSPALGESGSLGCCAVQSQR